MNLNIKGFRQFIVIQQIQYNCDHSFLKIGIGSIGIWVMLLVRLVYGSCSNISQYRYQTAKLSNLWALKNDRSMENTFEVISNTYVIETSKKLKSANLSKLYHVMY